MTTHKKVKKETIVKETPKEEVKNEVIDQVQESKEIKVIERVFENRDITAQDAFGKLSRSQLDLIKRTIAKGASDDELSMFIQICKGANLNPFLRQVFLVPRWDSKLGKEVRTVQVSIDGFRAIAEEGGQYAGNEDPEFTGEAEIKLEKSSITHPLTAKVTVYKMVQGQRFPFSATARWSEYYPGEKMGFQWHQRPYLMLGKCAEALALRKAFPKLLSGMYAQEELEKSSGPVDETAEDVAKKAEGINKMIGLMTKEKLEDFKKKMQGSKKYTSEQMKKFDDLVKQREFDLSKKVETSAEDLGDGIPDGGE